MSHSFAQRYIRFIAIISLIAVILIACNNNAISNPPPPSATLRPGVAPSATPNFLATLSAGYQEATVQAFIAANPEIASSDEWPIAFADAFDADEDNWPVEPFDNEYVSGDQEISLGRYRWGVTAKQSSVWRVWPDADAVSDFYMSVEGQRASGADNAQYGLIFRLDEDNNFYLFEIRENPAEFAFYVYYQDEWVALIDYTASAAIRRGVSNRVAISASGSDFAFFINDQFVAQAGDDRLLEGQVGLLVELSAAGDQATFEFDNFELRAP